MAGDQNDRLSFRCCCHWRAGGTGGTGHSHKCLTFENMILCVNDDCRPENMLFTEQCFVYKWGGKAEKGRDNKTRLEFNV